MALPRLPATDLDIAAALRSQSDELAARCVQQQHEIEAVTYRNARLHEVNIELQRQVEDLQRVLVNTADDVIRERGPSFWSKATHACSQRNAKLLLEIEKHKRWHREHGEEATRLQADLAAERRDRDRDRSLLESTQDRVAALEAQLDKLRERLAGNPSTEVD